MSRTIAALAAHPPPSLSSAGFERTGRTLVVTTTGLTDWQTMTLRGTPARGQMASVICPAANLELLHRTVCSFVDLLGYRH